MRRETDSPNWGGRRKGSGGVPASPGSKIHTIQCNAAEWEKIKNFLHQSRLSARGKHQQELAMKSDPFYSWDSRNILIKDIKEGKRKTFDELYEDLL